MDTQLDQFIVNLKILKPKYTEGKIVKEIDNVTVVKAKNSQGQYIYLKRIKLIDTRGNVFSMQLLSFKRIFAVDRFKEEQDKYLNDTINLNRHLATEPYIYNNILCNGCKYIIHHNEVFKQNLHQNEICIELASSGVSLHDILMEMTEKQQIFKLESLYQVTENILRALQYCHASNIIHCDVKCSNIIYDPVKKIFCLFDFGVARIKPERYGMLPHSSDVNPDTYQPPEILLGKPFNEKVDIFSLGCMLSAILNWKETFTNTIEQISYPQQRARYIHDQVSNGKSLTYIKDPVLKCFIVSLLSYEIDDRPNSSVALENLLVSLL
jgi:serine/threonine protein kinase